MTELAHFIPDENLRAAILAKFAAESRIASTNVRVGVLNGIAHLAGEVDSLAKRSMAEDLAREIPGVRFFHLPEKGVARRARHRQPHRSPRSPKPIQNRQPGFISESQG